MVYGEDFVITGKQYFTANRFLVLADVKNKGENFIVIKLCLVNVWHNFLSYQLSKRLQEKGWKVGDLLQAVLKYYDVTEKTHSEDKCKSLFDWLLENA